MRVILLSDYVSLGFVGDVVEVKRGYARNFLIPRGIAIDAQSRRGRESAHKFEMVARKKAKFRKEAEALAKRMEGLILEFKLAFGKHGKAYGSVGVKELVAGLADKGFEVGRKQLKLAESFKTAGEFPIKVKLHSEVNGEVTARIIPIEESKTIIAQESVKSAPKAAAGEAEDEMAT